MRPFCYLHIALLGLLLLTASAAEAGVFSGAAELRIGEFRAQEGGETVTESSHFAQQYSLLYETGGTFLNGRAGTYDFALGAEWTSLRSEVNDEVFDVDTPKVLYRGDVLLAPGGLPFRLHLYSRDMHQTQLIEGGAPGIILEPEMLTDIQNGQHIRSGATLMLGIRNGSYMGRYRDVLSQMPRLLFDYQEDYVRDIESLHPQHYRTRNLAFVSLNKKDNWFHYRYLDHTDYMDRNQDFVEKSFILGTIDHTMQRQWINLTNWIKVSVDGSYTVGNQTRVGFEDRERYDINLFTTARRPSWNASNFTTFHRVSEGGTLEKEIEIPFFLNGDLSRETSWRFRFLANRQNEQIFETGDETDYGSVFASGQIEAFKQQRYIVSPLIEAEVKRGDSGTGENVRARVELYSNRRYSPRHDLFGSYSLARFAGTAVDGTAVEYWEQEAVGRIETDINPRIRTGFEEKLIYGSGTIDRQVTERISPIGDLPVGDSLAGAQRHEGSVLRSISTWFGEHRSALRLDNRIEAVYDLRSADEGTEDQIVLRHALRYERRTLIASMRNELTLGGSQSGTAFTSSDLGTGSGIGIDKSFLHMSTLRYSPSRIWDATAEVNYNWTQGPQGDTSRWFVRQEYLYRFFDTRGFGRKVAEMGEELEYERFTDFAGAAQARTSFSLLGNYYPTRTTLLGARLRYRYYEPAESSEFTYFLTAGLSFAKFQVSLDYAYGTLSAGDDLPDRKEHRWEAKVKKIF